MSRTWGLDMSTSARKTAAVALEWSEGVATVVEVVHPLPAARIIQLMTRHADETWAVDVPFGWPDGFVHLMSERHDGPLPSDLIPSTESWEIWRTREISQRLTDRFLTDDERIRTRPLPASFQLLGATAAMWSLIEAKLAQAGVAVDRSGATGRVCETYPRAALAAWTHRGAGKVTLASLQDLFPCLDVPAMYQPAMAVDDVRDALVCALVARARDLGLTVLPDDDQVAAARREGWIHVSLDSPNSLCRPDPPTTN